MQVSKPTISVVMAVFDTPIKYLDISIASVLQQSWSDFEFIIVDDGSNSATGNQLELWAGRDHRIRLLKLPANVGLTKALNLGLQIALGDYLARQDADDISGAHRFAAQLKYLTLHPRVDAVGTDAYLINVGGNKLMPIDVESVILQAPGVIDCRVFGEPNALLGQVVSAEVVPAPDQSPEPLRAGIRQFCRTRLPAYKVPVSIKFLTNIMGNRIKKSRTS